MAAPIPNRAIAQVQLDQQPLTSEEVLCWLALSLTPGLGTRKAGQLVEVFQTASAIFRASREELEHVGIPRGTAQNIASGCAFDAAAEQQQKAHQQGVHLVPVTDLRYPPALRAIFDAPPLLFARGRVELFQNLMLGVVGTRRPTPYGIQAATRLSRELAEAGMTIVSGMARGIDTAAQKAALEAGGDTVAVFGCGVDQVYPAENRKLADEIAKNGLLLSEFSIGTPPYPQNFPIRNRIISGMSVGVMIVEGSEYSGSAITAKLAAEQDREVFAVPGNITSKMSWGPNLLIKQGAKLVQDWNDVAAELKPAVRRKLTDQRRNLLKLQEKESPETNTPLPASPIQGQMQQVLKLLQPDVPTSLDTLVDNSEICTPSELLAVLFELELAGLVRQLPGKSYIRVWTD